MLPIAATTNVAEHGVILIQKMTAHVLTDYVSSTKMKLNAALANVQRHKKNAATHYLR